MATDGKNGHGLKLEKAGPTFSSLHDLPAKITKNNVVVDASQFYRSILCTGKGVGNDFSAELNLKKIILLTIRPCNLFLFKWLLCGSLQFACQGK